MRAGSQYFLKPSVPAQRRYEALRAYIVEGLPAAQVAERFGYSTSTLHQLAAELRAGRSEFFRSSKPGPRGPRKAHTIRDRVLTLRSEDLSVTDIAAALGAGGTPVSTQTVWSILHAEGIERLGRRRPGGPPPRIAPVKARALPQWPAGSSWACDHAGPYRVKRSSNVSFLEGLARRCTEVGLYSGEAGFNLDFHAIRHHGGEVPLEKHYVPTRSQRTRSVLTFFAQDHASTEMVYANADLTKAEQAGEVLAFAEYWSRVSGKDPGLLCFDSQLTNYMMLEELCARGITFLTLRQRGKNVLEALASLPASAWSTHTIKRSGRYRRPQIHEEIVHLKGVEHPLRQIAIRNIGHEEPTLLVTNDLAATAAKDLFARYAERMIIENELDADISGFHLNALSSGLPLNVDLDTTLTVAAGNCYRLLARTLPRYELATPDRIWRHFLDNTGTVTVAEDHVRVDLALRTYTPVLIDAGFPELDIPVPWWGGRSLRFGFPPR